VLQAQRAPLVGADVVELNPDRDINGMTATVAAKLVRELCAYACSRAENDLTRAAAEPRRTL
jgi:arginase family enzyme